MSQPTRKPKPHEAPEAKKPSPGSVIHVLDMWAIVFPNGQIVTGSECQTEDDAWWIALGWPSPEDVEDAKRTGAFAVKATLQFETGENPVSH